MSKELSTQQGLVKSDGKLPDNKLYTNRFEIKSESSDRLYIVAQNKATGNWSCSCMGWLRNRKCKHLTALLPLLESKSKATKRLK